MIITKICDEGKKGNKQPVECPATRTANESTNICIVKNEDENFLDTS